MNPLLEVLCNEINKLKKALTTTGSDYTATVTKVEGDTAYVQIAGSDISDTPVALSINADVGDRVRVRVANGKAWITGNDTLPPSNDKKEVGTKMMKDMSDRAEDIIIDSGKMEFIGNTLVVDSDNFKLDEDGNATFGGTLSAAGGSFNGKIVCIHRNDWTVNICDPNYTYPIYIRYRDFENVYSWFTGLTMGFKSGTSEAYMNASGVHTSSDIRLKEDITMIDPATAKHLLPVQFRFKGDDKIHYGFIAQDVQKVMPAAVLEGENGYLSLTYHELIAPLYALVQEQEDRIDRLEIRLKALEDKK